MNYTFLFLLALIGTVAATAQPVKRLDIAHNDHADSIAFIAVLFSRVDN